MIESDLQPIPEVERESVVTEKTHKVKQPIVKVLDQEIRANTHIINEENQVHSDETLSWLLSSVDYGKFKEKKIRHILEEKSKTNDDTAVDGV